MPAEAVKKTMNRVTSSVMAFFDSSVVARAITPTTEAFRPVKKAYPASGRTSSMLATPKERSNMAVAAGRLRVRQWALLSAGPGTHVNTKKDATACEVPP